MEEAEASFAFGIREYFIGDCLNTTLMKCSYDILGGAICGGFLIVGIAAVVGKGALNRWIARRYERNRAKSQSRRVSGMAQGSREDEGIRMSLMEDVEGVDKRKEEEKPELNRNREVDSEAAVGSSQGKQGGENTDQRLDGKADD